MSEIICIGSNKKTTNFDKNDLHNNKILNEIKTYSYSA